MNINDLKKKLAQRSPLSNNRTVITPVNLYDVPKETKDDNQIKENKDDEKTHNRTNAQSHQKTRNTISRVSRGYKLREDVIKRMKRLAIKLDKHLYEVMEEAMLAHLEKNHG